MKHSILLISILLAIFISPSSAQNTIDSPVLQPDIDTTFVVYLGTYKKAKSFEVKDVPYELVELRDACGKYLYFYGKFKTKCDALHAQNIIYLAGYAKSKIRNYVDYKNNPDVSTYAQVCSR